MTNMDDALNAAAAALAKVDAQVAAAEARRAGMDQLAGEIATLTATVRSPQGEVSVEAQSSGRIVQVAVTEGALKLSAIRLSQLVTETVAEAQRKAALAAVDRSARVLGEESPLVGQLRSEAEVAYPAPGGASSDIGYR